MAERLAHASMWDPFYKVLISNELRHFTRSGTRHALLLRSSAVDNEPKVARVDGRSM